MLTIGFFGVGIIWNTMRYFRESRRHPVHLCVKLRFAELAQRSWREARSERNEGDRADIVLPSLPGARVSQELPPPSPLHRTTRSWRTSG